MCENRAELYCIVKGKDDDRSSLCYLLLACWDFLLSSGNWARRRRIYNYNQLYHIIFGSFARGGLYFVFDVVVKSPSLLVFDYCDGLWGWWWHRMAWHKEWRSSSWSKLQAQQELVFGEKRKERSRDKKWIPNRLKAHITSDETSHRHPMIKCRK